MIRILTDSTSDLSPARAAELGVEILPLTVLFGEEAFQDGVEITKEEFYARLEQVDTLPTTAQIPPETFIQTFERLTENGDQVLAILISSAMSGTYQSAMIARGIVDESNIAVVDAQTVTFGMGLLVEAACLLRDKGFSLSELKGQVEEMCIRDRRETLASPRATKVCWQENWMPSMNIPAAYTRRVHTAMLTSSGSSLKMDTKTWGKSSMAPQAAVLKASEEKKSRRKVFFTRSICPAP